MESFSTNTNVSILLVEDDEHDYILTRELLSDSLNYDYKIDWVAEFDDALTQIAENRHDLYLVDYRLGPHSGLDLLKQAIENGCTAPIIIVTGQGDESIDHEAMRCGAEAYLTKGFENAETLERVIRYALARKVTEAALRESEQRQRTILENIDEVVYFLTLDQKHQSTRTEFVTQQAEGLTGYSRSEFLQHPNMLFDIAHPDDRDSINDHAEDLFRRTKSTTLQYRIKHKNTGEYRWLENRIIPQLTQQGTIESLIGIARDITDSKNREAELTQAAMHDKLTGLPNRAMLLDHLEGAINRGKRHKDFHWAVLFIDLDHFKPVNDNLGHQAGDDLLVAISQRLSECIRPGDTLARLGGDEFVILLEDMHNESDASRVAERIHRALAPAHHLAGEEVFCTASIGITLHREKYIKADQVLKDADSAMYQAKKAGKAQYAIYETSMYSVSLVKQITRDEILQALEHENFEIYYQPIVSLETNQIDTLEALVRWNHPIWGILKPEDFLPLAEESGLIIPIGKWVMRAACEQQAKWKQLDRNYNSCVSINLAPRQFSQSDFLDFIKTTVSETGLQGNDISFDLPESAIPKNQERAEQSLQAINQLGIDMAIDNFGEGQTSLSNLYQYPVNRIKIDKSFIEGMQENNRYTAIIRSIIQLAHNLGIKVVAEYVEQEGQLSLLKTLACDYAQGYLFSRPLTTTEATSHIQRPRNSLAG